MYQQNYNPGSHLSDEGNANCDKPEGYVTNWKSLLAGLIKSRGCTQVIRDLL